MKAPSAVWRGVTFVAFSLGALVFARMPAGASCAWQVFSTPDAPNLPGFNAIAAVSDADVWALSGANFAEHWDGTGWTIYPIRNSSEFSGTTAISMVSSTDGWIVGFGFAAKRRQLVPVAQRWNGNSWIGVRTADVSALGGGRFDGVTALASNDVWAVGTSYSGSAGGPEPLAEHWDGTKWSRVKVPGNDAGLDGVAGSGSSDVWAVGTQNRNYGERAVIEHWDGAAWTWVKTPLAGRYSELYAVTAISPTDAWAVGSLSRYPDSTSGIEHWDGSAWTVMRLSPPLRTIPLYGIAYQSADAVWAVGAQGNPQQARKLFWNGSTWQNTIGIDQRYATLYGVSIPRPSGLPWVAGAYHSNHTGDHPFVAREQCSP
jgi:hypothetical protein